MRIFPQPLPLARIAAKKGKNFAVADRIIVLRLGRRAATFDVRGVSREQVVSAITGAEFGVGANLPKGKNA